MDYQKQAQEFLDKTGVTLTVEYIGKQKHFYDDKEERDVYKFTIKKGTREYSARFGDSIANTAKKEVHDLKLYGSNEIMWNCQNKKARKAADIASKFFQHFGSLTQYNALELAVKQAKTWKAPGAYDILSCLTKYDPGTFSDFCSEYGYDDDSISAKKTYEAVRDEYLNLAKLFSDEEMEAMAEIQ